MLLGQLNDFVVDKIHDLKGQNVATLDVRGKSSITDFMILCTGTSGRHVRSIAEHIIDSVKKEGILPFGSEGEVDGEWIVVDLGSVIVHVMQDDARQLYELEKLWG